MNVKYLIILYLDQLIFFFMQLVRLVLKNLKVNSLKVLNIFLFTQLS